MMKLLRFERKMFVVSGYNLGYSEQEDKCEHHAETEQDLISTI